MTSRKLYNYVVRETDLNWIASYLKGKNQQVIIKNTRSEPFQTYTGVPQGSNVGPSLFVIFIYDLVASLGHSQIVLYADHAKIFAPVNSPIDFDRLQRDIGLIALWGEANRIQSNISKCNVVTFTRYKTPSIYDCLLGDETINRAISDMDMDLMTTIFTVFPHGKCTN